MLLSFQSWNTGVVPKQVQVRPDLALPNLDFEEGPVRQQYMVTAKDDSGTLVIAGEVDMRAAPFIRSIIAARQRIVAVDCSGVTFMDSAGFHAIVDPPHGRTILIVDPSPAVAYLLDLFDRDDLWWSADRPLVSAS